MRHLNCHKTGLRDYNKKFEKKEIQKNAPIRLDLRLNGQCNLECIMCDVWKDSKGPYENSDLWTWGKKSVFPFLKEIDILGGEPFIQKDTYRLIDTVSSVNKDCIWNFVTNANYKFSTYIEEKLDKIKIRRIGVSLDAVSSKTYEKVRKNGNLSLALQTIRDLKKYQIKCDKQKRPFSMVVSMCVQKANFSEIKDFLDFAEKENISPRLQFAYTPFDMSLLSMERRRQEKILKELVQLTSQHGFLTLRSIIVPLVESLNKAVGSSKQQVTL